MTDSLAVGLVILAAMVALVLYAAFEMRRAVVRDDWTSSGDERAAAEWARREVQAAFDRHVAAALDVANAEPVFSATIRAMPVSQSALVVAGWLLAWQVGPGDDYRETDEYRALADHEPRPTPPGRSGTADPKART